MESQRVRHNWVTELNWTELNKEHQKKKKKEEEEEEVELKLKLEKLEEEKV